MIETLEKLEREISANLPFIAKSFGKHMETVVEKAKVEVNAYANAAIARAGLEALGGKAPLQLGSGSTPAGSPRE